MSVKEASHPGWALEPPSEWPGEHQDVHVLTIAAEQAEFQRGVPPAADTRPVVLQISISLLRGPEEVRGFAAEEIGFAPADEFAEGGVDVGDFAIEIGDDDAGGDGFFNCFAQRILVLEAFLGEAAGTTGFGLLNFPADGGGEPCAAVLHDIIIRTGAHALDGFVLTDLAGDDHERDVASCFLNYFEGVQAGKREALDAIVRDDDVPGLIQGGAEIVGGFHALGFDEKAALVQGRDVHEKSIIIGILD